MDQRRVDRVQRALGERREGADRLDLVAEELDPERLAAGRREDVDEPAADGELAALLDALDPLVARERERLGELLERPLAADLELERLRALIGRRHALGERRCRRADEPAAREHVERTSPLADEVRRRLEPGAPADAAARQQPDALRPEEPGRGVGGVARVLILGHEDDERALELLVERREHERQRRLGHARPRRQRSGERLEALVGLQLAHERVQDGPFGEGLSVQAVRRNRAVPQRPS